MHRCLGRLKTQPFFLLKYFAAEFAAVGAVVAAQLYCGAGRALLTAPLRWDGLYFLPFGLVLAVIVPVWMHNSVHGNFRPQWLNRIVGEVCGLAILLGMEAFALNHLMHHAHHDTELDPHNPHQRNFLHFFFANNFGGTAPVRRKYLGYHGDTRQNNALFSVIIAAHFVNVPIRIVFWVLLLGPSLFLTAFLPAYLFHMFVFAHINFVTHETLASGKVVVKNLDSNLYYRFVNFFGSGVYFHRNHHVNPAVFNPRLGASRSRLVR